MFSEFRMILQIWEATTTKRMKVEPYCQQQNCCTKSTFQRCIDYVDIAERSSARSLQAKYSGRKWRFSTSVHENISQNGK